MEQFPDLVQMQGREQRLGAGRELLRAGRDSVAFEHKSLYITKVDAYRTGLEWVKSVSLALEDLSGVKRIHLEFYGGQGVLIYPDPEAGVLRMASVRWRPEGNYRSFTDTPKISEAPGEVEVRIESFWAEDVGMYVTPPWLNELEKLILVSEDPGRLETLRVHLQSVLKNLGERIRDFSRGKYPEKLVVGSRVRIGYIHLSGFEGLILPPLREIGIEREM